MRHVEPTTDTPDRALDFALALARWRIAVFPLFPGKQPGAGSRGHLDATSDPEAVRDLWRRFPGPFVGYATGAASGVDVLDVDLGKHKAARWWWHHNLQHLGGARIYATPSGGIHLWMRHSPGLRCSQSRIFTGIDVRADGGFAVAWWLHGCAVVRQGRLTDWPAWLLARARPRMTVPRPARGPRWPRTDAGDALTRARIAGVLSTVRKATIAPGTQPRIGRRAASPSSSPPAPRPGRSGTAAGGSRHRHRPARARAERTIRSAFAAGAQHERARRVARLDRGR